jgi:hypothetical protein
MQLRPGGFTVLTKLLQKVEVKIKKNSLHCLILIFTDLKTSMLIIKMNFAAFFLKL